MRFCVRIPPDASPHADDRNRGAASDMTSTRDAFTLSLYLTVCLAGAMLWGAEGTFSQAALTLPVAVAAFLCVERRGLTLPAAAANGLGLLAIAAALVELWLRDVEGRLLFGAHLLVYLTWILLWLPKTSRQRWGLIALAVLQIGVGSVLTNNGLYGLGMAAFLTLAVWTLALFQLDEAESRHAPAALPPVTSGRSAALLLGPGGVAPVAAATFGRWPMRQVAAVVAVTVAGAIGVGAAFFLLVPRFEVARRSFSETEAPLARQRVTGFTEEVKLGEFGQILESTVPVFEVRLYDNEDDSKIDVAEYAQAIGYEEPLFRGAVLATYRTGSWKSDDRPPLSGLRQDLRRTPRVRQEYRIQPIAAATLFAIAPVFPAGYVVGSDDQLRSRVDTGTLARPSGRRHNGEISYVVFSPLTPEQLGRYHGRFSPSGFSSERFFGRRGGDPYLQMPPDGLGTLREVAAGIARPGGGGVPPRTRAARLAAWLRDSGEFGYSLSGEIVDPKLDPVEDFLLNRKSGHCEYFAAALALMLRAEEIPCRVVTGFKGGEVNGLSGAFEVQQRHAHAWVEAEIDGRWETLDPTPPAARNESVAANAPPVPLWGDLKSAAAGFWSNYVVQMNLARQRRTLAPLREAATAAAASLRENWWPALKRQAYALATDPSRWVSWQGGVATFFLLLFGVGSWRLTRSISRRVARVRAARRAEALRGRRVEFYERFRRLCERRGWRPATGQTPREFAAGVTDSLGRLAAPLVPALLAGLPAELTEDFYRVRFGELDLDESEVRVLDERLGEFEAALAGPSSR